MYEKQRLSNSNIEKYAGQPGLTKLKTVPGIKSLLQNDYGEANDCTLTSITCVIRWMRPSVSANDIYNQVEKTAKNYGYKGNYGTPTLVIKGIYQKIINAFGLKKKVHSRYLKNIGFGWNYIKKEIDEHQPVLLNLWKDGRDFYKNHTVLIVGYLEIAEKRFLAIYDNWYHGVSYIDYDKLNAICSIDFLEND